MLSLTRLINSDEFFHPAGCQKSDNSSRAFRGNINMRRRYGRGRRKQLGNPRSWAAWNACFVI